MEIFGMPQILFEGEGAGSGGGGEGAPPAADPSLLGGEAAPPAASTIQEGHAFAKLPADVLSNPSIQKFVEAQDPLAALAAGYVGVQKLVGVDPSQVVRMDSLKEVDARTAHLQALGAPKEASGYEFKAAEGTPEELAAGPVLDAMKEAAAKVGVLPDQFQEVVAAGIDVMAKQGQADPVDHNANIAALQLAFGDKFDLVSEDVVRAVEKTGGKELKEKLEAAGLATDPVIFKHFAEVGKLVPNDDAASGLAGTAGAGGMSKQGMLARADDLNRQAVRTQAEDPFEARRMLDEAVALRMKANGETLPQGM